MAPTGIPAQELAHSQPLLPRLTPADAVTLADDLTAARAAMAAPADALA